LEDGTFTYNTSSDEENQLISVIYYTSLNTFTLTSNQFIGEETYDEDDVWESIEEGEFNHKTAIYISSIATVTSTENTFSYFNYNEYGGVFFIDSATFTDEGSTFLKNSALNGGVIYC